ncbi:MAG TPA: hypothetical protein VM094_02030 [Gemmatimonadales bacterium]|nr:hypothetical protein [Gemmatimonadales bacterium]
MIPTAALLASAGATIVLIAACVWIAKTTAELRQELDQLKAQERFAPPGEPEAGRRTPQRMMRALYPERSNPLDIVGGIPAGPAFAVGGVLALLAVVLGLTGSAPAPQPRPEAEAVATLRAAMDSVAGDVRKLRDSLRLTAAASAAPRPTAPTARPSRRPAPTHAASPPPSPQLPPAPSIQPTQAGVQTTPP